MYTWIITKFTFIRSAKKPEKQKAKPPANAEMGFNLSARRKA